MISVIETAAGRFRVTETDGVIEEITPTNAPSGCTSPSARRLKEELDEYFAGERRVFTVSYRIKGTAFQTKVFAELEKIPYGETRSYRDIARAIGNPKACRAVGGAIHRNPLLILVPCHRVIGSDGSLMGFGAGPQMKRCLLKLEGAEFHD